MPLPFTVRQRHASHLAALTTSPRSDVTRYAEPLPLIQVLLPHLRVLGSPESVGGGCAQHGQQHVCETLERDGFHVILRLNLRVYAARNRRLCFRTYGSGQPHGLVVPYDFGVICELVRGMRLSALIR